MVGYFCSYAPEELIYAAGALPFRLFGTNEGIHLADTHLQSYCCSLVRGILEEALSGRLNFIDGVIFPHTCDSFQRLSDIWRLNITQQFHLDIVLPVKLDTPSARQYFIDVLEKFRKDLGKALGINITDAMLTGAVKTYNQIRKLMTTSIQIRSQKTESYKRPGFPQYNQSSNDYGKAILLNRSQKSKRGWKKPRREN